VLACLLGLFQLVKSDDFYDDDEEFVSESSHAPSASDSHVGYGSEYASRESEAGTPTERGQGAKSHEFDEEEFEGFDNKDDKPPEITFKSTSRNSLSFSLSDFKMEDYYMEMAILVFFVLYGLNYFYGKRENAEIVSSWLATSFPVFEKNFTYFGDGKGTKLIKDSESDYIFYASGRLYCRSLTAQIELRKRHDLVSVLQEFAFPSYDRIKIEVLMNDKDMESFVFAVIPKRKYASMKKDYYDLANVAKIVNASDILPDNFIVATDCSDLIDTVLTRNVIQILKEYGQYFDGLRFSDLPKTKPTSLDQKSPKTLAFHFKIPSVRNMEKLNPLLEMIFLLMDNVAENLDLTKEMISKVQKKRAPVIESLTKEANALKLEEAQKKKEERLKKQKEEVATMSPEQQAKWEAKNYQKELKKKNQARVKVIKA